MDAKIVGGKIAQARKEKQISQAQLAQQLFISPQAVGKWERGESVPDIITINRLAEILNVDLNYFSETHSSTGVPKPAVEAEAEQAVMNDPIFRPADRELLTKFNGSNLVGSDFSGVTAHNRKFNGSALRGANFAGADLTGTSFSGSDIREADFDGANLTDCIFSALDLTDASFNNTILTRTAFTASTLAGAKFTGAKFTDAKLSKTDLTKTIFENCTFHGVDFNHSDLRGVRLDGQTFTGVKFDNTTLNETSFHGATLKNVSFQASFALTNKYYKAIATINFNGATMDKLTYAALKGIGAELENVIVV